MQNNNFSEQNQLKFLATNEQQARELFEDNLRDNIAFVGNDGVYYFPVDMFSEETLELSFKAWIDVSVGFKMLPPEALNWKRK